MRAILVLIALLTAGFRQTPAELPVADESIQRFVRAALEDRLAAKNLPDFGMMREMKRIGIREEMPVARLRLDKRALPHVHGLDFDLLAQATLQARADYTKETVAYMIVDGPVITGDDASVTLGMDIAIPTSSRVGKLCCCESEGKFHRVDGRWTFVRWGLKTCS